MKITDLTLDEILHYGSLGEVTISSREEWYVLETLIDRKVTEADTGGYVDGIDDGEKVGYDKGWAECVKHYEIEE